MIGRVRSSVTRSKWADSMTPAAFSRMTLLAGAVALGPLAAGDALAQDTFRARYSVKLIGLALGTASLNGTFEPSSYQIEATARLAGVATMVSNSKGAATSSGVFLQGKVAPNAFATTAANSTTTRTVRMALKQGNVTASEISPPFEELPGRVPVLELHKQKVIDPLSALVMPVPGEDKVLGPAACNRSLPVYDGWARFNINLSYVGLRQVKAKGYEGPVAVCNARYIPVAGHRPDRPGTKFMENNKQMEVWLVPVGESRIAVPFRISVATMIGTTVIEATDFEATAGTRASR